MTDHSNLVETATPLQRRPVQGFLVLTSFVACLFFACRMPPPTASAPRAQSAILLDLNSASVRELSLLPGIGPVLAHRIVQNRQRLGRFASVQSLQRVHGIGPKTVTRAEMFCVVNENDLRWAAK